MYTLMIVIGFIVGCIFLSLERDTVKGVLRECLMLVGRVLMVVQQQIGRLIVSVSGFSRDQIAEEDERSELLPPSAIIPSPEAGSHEEHAQTMPAMVGNAVNNRGVGRHHLSRIIMAVVFTALSAVFVTADIYIYKLTLAAMGMGSMTYDAPVSVDWMAAGAVIAVAILWGLVLIDLYRGTQLLPSRFTQGPAKKPFLYLAWGSIISIAVAGLLIGAWRTHKLVETSWTDSPVAQSGNFDGGLQIGSSQPVGEGSGLTGGQETMTDSIGGMGQSHAWINVAAPMAFNIVLAVLVILATVVAFTGPMYLLKYLGILFLGMIILPFVIIALILRGSEEVILTLNNLKDHAIDFLANLGGRILHVVGPPAQELIQGLQARFRVAIRTWANTPIGASTDVLDAPVSPVVMQQPVVLDRRQAGSVPPEETYGQPSGAQSDDITDEEVEDLQGWDPLNLNTARRESAA